MKPKACDLKDGADVRAVLDYYGATVFLDNESQIRSNCIIHGGDNSTSLVYSKYFKTFKCFGECGFQGDVLQLIMVKEGCSFSAAMKRLQEFSTVREASATEEKRVRDPWLEALESSYGAKVTNEKIYSPLVEKALEFRPNPYVSSGRFTQDTIDYFEVGYCNFNEYFMDRAIITIHDEEGNLVGFSGRDMRNAPSPSKYRIKKGFKKGACLYNLHRAKKFVSIKSPLIITEGFGQVWRLNEAGYKTGVALMGKEATDTQLALILRYATSVILALDFDDAGIEATKKLIEKLDDRINVKVVVTKLGKDLDLGDLDCYTVSEMVESAIPAYVWVYEQTLKDGGESRVS
jgi:DNA primase